MKRLVWIFLAGAAIGGSLTVWLAPKVIVWYFDPPKQFGFNCTEPIAWALTRLQWSQFFGVLGGGLLFVFLSLLFFRRTETPELTEGPKSQG